MKLFAIAVGWFVLFLKFVEITLLTGMGGVIGLRFLGQSPFVAITGWMILLGGMVALGILAHPREIRELRWGNPS